MAIQARIVRDGPGLEARVDGQWVATPDGRRGSIAEATFAPPCQPTKVVCVGFNYRDHAAELSWEPRSVGSASRATRWGAALHREGRHLRPHRGSAAAGTGGPGP